MEPIAKTFEQGRRAKGAAEAALGIRANSARKNKAGYTRGRSGCTRCRKRKKKCDEAKPSCTDCKRLGFICTDFRGFVSTQRVAETSDTLIDIQQLQSSSRNYNDIHAPKHSFGSDQENHAGPYSRIEHAEKARRYDRISACRPPAPNSGQEEQVKVFRPTVYSPFFPIECRQSLEHHESQSYPHINPQMGTSCNLPSIKTLLSQHSHAIPCNATLPGLPSLREPTPTAQTTGRQNKSKGKPSIPCDSHLEHSGMRAYKQISEARSTQDRGGRCLGNIPLGKGGHATAPFHCEHSCNIVIGENVVIGRDCQLFGCDGITIGSNTWIGARVTINALETPADRRERYGTKSTKKIHIGKNVYVGAGCTIQTRVWIGDNVIIRPGSVVFDNIPANCIAAGNPATSYDPANQTGQAHCSRLRSFDHGQD